MARRYLCDNCGKEVTYDWCLHSLTFTGNWKTYPSNSPVIPSDVLVGEYCSDCAGKIEAKIKEGVN